MLRCGVSGGDGGVFGAEGGADGPGGTKWANPGAAALAAAAVAAVGFALTAGVAHGQSCRCPPRPPCRRSRAPAAHD
eukprot:scaffold96417_cov66-Phaeocystis_antarctica.AAC.2